MLMTDGEIKEALNNGKLNIAEFSEDSLQPASYDMRVGKRLLASNEEVEIDLSKKGSALIAPGSFALVTTHESVSLPNDMAGHIGIRSYYTRKGLVMLTGLQIDPGFEGVLVIGLYNASPRSLTLEYLAPFCTVEFHKLARPSEKPFVPGAEQRLGQIPRADKDYLRTLETQSLSEMSRSLRELTQDIATLTGQVALLTGSMKILQYLVTVGLAVIALLVALKR